MYNPNDHRRREPPTYTRSPPGGRNIRVPQPIHPVPPPVYPVPPPIYPVPPPIYAPNPQPPPQVYWDVVIRDALKRTDDEDATMKRRLDTGKKAHL